MRTRKSVRVSFWILVGLILSLFVVQGVVATPGVNVKYIYYGKEWSPQEMLTRFADGKGQPFHCVQHVTEAAYRGELADLFYCWDTEEEAKKDSISQSFEQAKVDEYFKSHPWPGLTPQENLPAQPFTPALDGGVISDFSRLAFSGLSNFQNKIEETVIDGMSATEFDISLMYDKPMKFANFNETIYGIESKAFINTEGKLLELDVYNFYQDGIEKLTGSSKNFVVEILTNLPIEI